MKSLQEYVNENVEACTQDEVSTCLMMAQELGFDPKKNSDKVFQALWNVLGLQPICKLYGITDKGEDRKNKAMDKILSKWKW